MLIIILILLTGCSFTPYVTKEVVLSAPHVYESFGLDVPYYLDYYDGEKFHRLFLPSGVKEITLSFKGDALCPVVASPFGVAGPALGAASVPGKDSVKLTEREGQLALALLNAAAINAESVSILSYNKLLSLVPSSFEEKKFITEVASGTFSSFREKRRYTAVVSNLPSGLWFSAFSSVENILLSREGEEVCLNLYPGLYSFYNPMRSMEYILEVGEDGKVSWYIRN